MKVRVTGRSVGSNSPVRRLLLFRVSHGQSEPASLIVTSVLRPGVWEGVIGSARGVLSDHSGIHSELEPDPPQKEVLSPGHILPEPHRFRPAHMGRNPVARWFSASNSRRPESGRATSMAPQLLSILGRSSRLGIQLFLSVTAKNAVASCSTFSLPQFGHLVFSRSCSLSVSTSSNVL